ncbi:MAG: protein phosphatase CheZ [Enterovibrio sp.]
MITLRQAQDLVDLLEAGEQETAEQLFLQLTALNMPDLSRQVSLQQEGTNEPQSQGGGENAISDHLIEALSFAKLPEMKERLDFVVEKTQQAADKSMDVLEVIELIVDDWQNNLSRLRTHWRNFVQNDSSHTDEFAMSIDAIFDKMDFQCGSLRAQLNEILIAQEFQDLTGQVIAQVIKALQQLQTQFISITGLPYPHCAPDEKSAAVDLTIAEGPLVTQSQKQEKPVLKDQSEVDDLLSSLGL